MEAQEVLNWQLRGKRREGVNEEDSNGAGDGGTKAGGIGDVDMVVGRWVWVDRAGRGRGEGVGDPGGPAAGAEEGGDERSTKECGVAEDNRADGEI